MRILCVGAHSDDIEIGCGGSILRILEEHPRVEVHWIVLSATEDRAKEATRSADIFLENADLKNVIIKNFRDSFFPYMGGEIKEYFRTLPGICEPDMIFTHYHNDLHQDHRLLSELTRNTFRDHLILEYEIPKWDGDLDRPNFYFDLSTEIVEQKITTIVNSFKTQAKRDWFTKDIFSSIMRIRGMESRSPSRYAEAFFCRKLIV